MNGYEQNCYTFGKRTGKKELVRTITIALQLILLGIGIGRWVGMDIIAWVFIGIAIALTPVAIWGDKWRTRLTNWLRIKLNKKYEWLFNLESKQLADLGDYLFTEVRGIDYTQVADTHTIKVKVELLNLTIFTLDIAKVTLNAECRNYPLGIEMQDTTPKRQVWGQRHKYDLEYYITNTNFLGELKKASIHREYLNWKFHLTWYLKTALHERELTLKHTINFSDIPSLTPEEIKLL